MARDKPRDSYPTRPEEFPLRHWNRAAWIQRLLILLFAVPIVGALFGLVGLREADISSSAAGYKLDVHYSELSRAGLASPFDMRVHHEGGFDSPITLRINHEYMTLFDLNGIYPAPASESVDGEMVVWEFDPPQGDVLRVQVDWRVQPSVHSGTPGRVELVVDGGPITSVSFDTRVTP